MSSRFNIGFTRKDIQIVTWKAIDSIIGQVLNIYGPNRAVKIPIISGTKMPYSGIFLGEELCKQHLRVSLVIEIGAGAYAPSSLFLVAAHKNIKIDLVELNFSDSQNLQRVIKDNGLQDVMRVLHGNLFEKVEGRKYDLIISNIAQMPLAPGVPESIHDHGGVDGWKWIDQIISHASDYLNEKGHIGLLVFEFLGIIQRENPVKPSLLERLSNHNFKITFSSKFRRQIRVGGETERSLSHILSIYPNAPFYNKRGIRVDFPKSLAKSEPLFLDFYFILAKK